MNNNLNLLITISLSLAIIFGWQHFYEKPRLSKQTEQHVSYNNNINSIRQEQKTSLISREEALIQNSRVEVKTDMVQGSINTKGLRIDDLTLVKYKESLDGDRAVNLLSPSNTQEGYFASIGWLGDDMEYPNSDTVWQANKTEISVNEEVKFSWKNSQDVEFIVNISIDDNYMFSINSTIVNNSDVIMHWKPYGLINRYYAEDSSSNNNTISHQGVIASVDDKLKELSYGDLKDKRTQHLTNQHVKWLGLSSKYWITAFIPDRSYDYNANLTYTMDSKLDRYQVDFVGKPQILAPNSSTTINYNFLAGAKNINLLDEYSKDYNVPLLDRAVDFGWLYFITKPILYLLLWLNDFCGNLGISILALTVLLRLLMFPLANYSFKSMRRLKLLQPEIEKYKELYGDDKARLNQEVMQLYKREKANPFSSCLPLLLQLPIFFAIYKVLNVSIEMRQAPFYGWIHDLSALDPINIFNLFGLIPWDPPSMLHLGLWPIIMSVSMYMQQSLNPAPTDAVQAQVMKFMPLMFLVMFAKFPAGLLIYWTWSNVLSILQQTYVNWMEKKDAAK